jgi:small subunit ribosomal protein S4
MGRYKGPKARVNRALGMMVYEEKGATRALERRNRPPGMHARRRKASIYGLALLEKQKVKHYYGLGERQLDRMLDIARRRPGDTGLTLLLLLERRLDNVVRRVGFTRTRPQARQAVVHGHFLVKGRKVDKPSYLVQAGDVIRVRRRPNVQTIYRAILDKERPQPLPWLCLDPEQLEATVLSLPVREDISLPVEVSRLVEFET